MADYSLSRIISLHKKVAGRVKEYETIIGEFPPPDVLNEFRYALRALLEIIESSHDDNIDEKSRETNFNHLEERINHALLCAYHDLVDGLHVEITEIMNDLTKDYFEETITILGDKRIEIINNMQEISDKIIESRKNSTSRYKIYDEELYSKWFEILLGYRKFLYSNILNDIMLLRKANDKKTKIGLWGIWIGIIGTIVGVLGAIFGLISIL